MTTLKQSHDALLEALKHSADLISNILNFKTVTNTGMANLFGDCNAAIAAAEALNAQPEETCAWIIGDNDDFHEDEIIEMGNRLFYSVDKLCSQAGTETDETVDFLCGKDGGMFKLFDKYFSPQPTQPDMRDEEGKQYLRRWLASFIETHFPHNPNFQVSDDLCILATQIDNATCIIGEYKKKLASCQPDPIVTELLAALKEIHKNIGGDWASNEQINRAAYACKQAIKLAEGLEL